MVDKIHEIKDIISIVKDIFGLIIRLTGIIAFIMLIVSGFKYLTSGGDAEKAQSARNTITHAILGLVLIIAAWFILKFLSEFTGVNLTEFTFPGS